MLNDLMEAFVGRAPEAPAPMEADTILSMKELTEAVKDFLKKTGRIPDGAVTWSIQYWQTETEMTTRIAFQGKPKAAAPKAAVKVGEQP